MNKLKQGNSRSIDQLTAVIIKSIRQNPKFCHVIGTLCKNIQLGADEYNNIKNHSNIKKLIEFYSETISYEKNLLTQYSIRQKQLKRAILEKQKCIANKIGSVSYQNKKINQKEEKKREMIKLIQRNKSKNRKNSRSIKRKNSYQQNQRSLFIDSYYCQLPFYSNFPNQHQINYKNECHPTARFRKFSSCNQNNSFHYVEPIRNLITQRVHCQVQTSRNRQQCQLNDNMVNSARIKPSRINIMLNDQSVIQIKTKQLQQTHKSGLRDSSPIQIQGVQDDSFELYERQKMKKPLRNPSSVKKQDNFEDSFELQDNSKMQKPLKNSSVKIEGIFDNSFELQDNSKIKESQKPIMLPEKAKINAGITKYSNTRIDSLKIRKNDKKTETKINKYPREEIRQHSPVQVDNIQNEEDDIFNLIKQQSTLKKNTTSKNFKMSFTHKVNNKIEQQLITFKTNLHQSSEKDFKISESNQFRQSNTFSMKNISTIEKPTSKVTQCSSQMINEQSDNHQDISSTANDNNIRKKMIQLIRKHELSLTSKQNLKKIQQEIQEQYSNSKNWKQQIYFWRGIINKFEGSGKKEMTFYLADLSEFFAIINSSVTNRGSDIRTSQRQSKLNSKNRRKTQDRISISQKNSD